MPAACSTPECGGRARRTGGYCPECAADRRRALQRLRRRLEADPGPADSDGRRRAVAGPLPAEVVERLLTDMELVREVLDDAERRRDAIEYNDEPPQNLFPVFDNLTRRVRAALTSFRRETAKWEDLNNIETREMKKARQQAESKRAVSTDVDAGRVRRPGNARSAGEGTEQERPQ